MRRGDDGQILGGRAAIHKGIEGVKGKLDLSNFDVKDAAGLLGKLKGLFGK